MSDPVTNVEIEDVLSSIRRLVSEETRKSQPLAGAGAQSRQSTDRLVLTPALRVKTPEEDVPGADVASETAGASDAKLSAGCAGAEAVEPAETPAPPMASVELPEIEAEAARIETALETVALEVLSEHGPEQEPIHQAETDPLGRKAEIQEADPLTETAYRAKTPGVDLSPLPAPGLEELDEQSVDAVEEAPFVEVEAPPVTPAEPVAFTSRIARRSPPVPTSEPVSEVSPEVAPEVAPEMVPEVVPELLSEAPAAAAAEVDGAAMKADADPVADPGMNQAATSDLAVTSTSGTPFAMDETRAADDARMAPVSASEMAAPVAPEFDTVATSTPVAAPSASPVSDETALPMQEAPLQPAAGTTPPATASQAIDALTAKLAELEAKIGRKTASAETAFDPAPSPTTWQDPVEIDVDAEAEADAALRAAEELNEDLLRADEAILDEETLRELVADIVREELQGVLGERITRNVRKLVRREIHRALAAQDLG